MHNEWVRESVLMQIARRKLLNFKKRESEQPCNYIEKVGAAACWAGRLVACCQCLCHTCHACRAAALLSNTPSSLPNLSRWFWCI